MKRGFTLIELLVVIAIIGLLASVVIGSLAEVRAKGRDAKRLQDLRQLQLALELFYSDFGHYPIGDQPGSHFTNCWECPLSFSGFTNDLTKLNGSAVYDGLEFNSLGRVYLRPRPSDPLYPFPIEIGNCGYWYSFDSSGLNYKMAIVGSWEGDTSSIPETFRDTIYAVPLGSSENCPDRINKTISVYSSGAKCWAMTGSRNPCF